MNGLMQFMKYNSMWTDYGQYKIVINSPQIEKF